MMDICREKVKEIIEREVSQPVLMAALIGNLYKQIPQARDLVASCGGPTAFIHSISALRMSANGKTVALVRHQSTDGNASQESSHPTATPPVNHEPGPQLASYGASAAPAQVSNALEDQCCQLAIQILRDANKPVLIAQLCTMLYARKPECRQVKAKYKTMKAFLGSIPGVIINEDHASLQGKPKAEPKCPAGHEVSEVLDMKRKSGTGSSASPAADQQVENTKAPMSPPKKIGKKSVSESKSSDTSGNGAMKAAANSPLCKRFVDLSAQTLQ